MKARENPYRVEQLHALKFRFYNDSWDSLMSRLLAANYRGAIIGPHGTGKTTLTLELVERLKTLDFNVNSLRINSEHKTQAAALVEEWLLNANTAQILILDGAEQLSFFSWRKLLRCAKLFQGFIITCHSPSKLPTLYQT